MPECICMICGELLRRGDYKKHIMESHPEFASLLSGNLVLVKCNGKVTEVVIDELKRYLSYQRGRSATLFTPKLSHIVSKRLGLNINAVSVLVLEVLRAMEGRTIPGTKWRLQKLTRVGTSKATRGFKAQFIREF